MQLQAVSVKRFRNIVESGAVEIDPDVTCLVGKNESGKSSFLQALYRVNPARPAPFSILDHYPAWLEKRDRLRGVDIEHFEPVEATFVLDEADAEEINAALGDGVVWAGGKVVVGRIYEGLQTYSTEHDESKFVSSVVQDINWAKGTKTEANKLKTVSGLREYAEQLKNDDNGNPDYQQTAADINSMLVDRLGDYDVENAIWWWHVEAKLPSFLYFSEYSQLPYTVPIEKVLTSPRDQLSEGEQTAASLLRLAAADKDYLTNTDYERRKRELENVANSITQDVLEYWSQNPELRVLPDITQRTVPGPKGNTAVLDELKIRVYDSRHELSLPLNEHSTGFRWFFSFLAAFSEFEVREEPVVVLLDEPALGLHARAQKDFLRFIDERLAKNSQVIYTTHSPFMVEPGKLERVRLVEDRGKEVGATVSADVLSTDPDTLFPLQGALGYDIVQHLFINEHNLVLEGTSDYTYLRVISDHFSRSGSRTPLDDRWSLVPVGGADLIPTFVALLGTHLDLTVLIDATKSGNQKLQRLRDHGLLEANRLISIAMVTGGAEADVEDLFDPGDYLGLYNRAFEGKVNLGDLHGNDPIVRQLARRAGVDRFDHGLPADVLLRHRDEILPQLTESTLDRFESLFERINGTLTK
ncbi:MAG: AAA family ATPase [Dehalococcoidia bacterium]